MRSSYFLQNGRCQREGKNFLKPRSSAKLPCSNGDQNKETGQDRFWECPKNLETEADTDGATVKEEEVPYPFHSLQCHLLTELNGNQLEKCLGNVTTLLNPSTSITEQGIPERFGAKKQEANTVLDTPPNTFLQIQISQLKIRTSFF